MRSKNTSEFSLLESKKNWFFVYICWKYDVWRCLLHFIKKFAKIDIVIRLWRSSLNESAKLKNKFFFQNTIFKVSVMDILKTSRLNNFNFFEKEKKSFLKRRGILNLIRIKKINI